MFSKFMKDLDGLIISKTPRFSEYKFDEIVDILTSQQHIAKHTFNVLKLDEASTSPPPEGVIIKKRSKFDSSDEDDNDYEGILEIGDYEMVCDGKKFVGKWTTRDVHDVKFNEDKLTIQFRFGRLGMFGFAANRYSNLPYQTWELKPDPKGTGHVIFSLTASIAGFEVTVKPEGFTVNSIQGGTTSALSNIFGNTYSLRKLKNILRSAALDLFPEDDAFNYSNGSCEKNQIMEFHLYDCIGIFALSHSFGWSRWNLMAGGRTCVILMREILEHRRVPHASTLVVTPLKSCIVEALEVASSFNPTPTPGMDYYADLYHLGIIHSQPSSKVKQENMNPILRDNIVNLFKATRPLSFC